LITSRFLIPALSMKLYTHLNFGGTCEIAFRFYEQLLGGKITMMMKARDLPAGAPRPPNSGDEFVIHARMDVAGGELIGNDIPTGHFKPVRSSYLYLALDSAAETERVYAALAEGGEISMAIQETFFATRFAQLRDRFGVLWRLLHERAR
jgi:PhnB protein